MLGSAVNRYRTIQQATITPGELLLALYDGLFRFMNGAHHCLTTGDKPKAREFICKAHAIVSELYLALDHKASPELCLNLGQVYDYAMWRLMEANREASLEYLDDAIRVLAPLREAWQQAVPQAIKQGSLRGQ